MSRSVLTSNNLKRRCDSPEKEHDLLKKKPAEGPKRPSLVELSLGDFSTFAKQRFAIEEYMKVRHMWKDTRIFSYEIQGGTGERRYLVTTLQRFWKWYGQQKERHMYELIYEDMPCRLYFDLEYPKTANPGVDQQKAFDHFCSTLTTVLKETYNIVLNSSKDLLILDSSTDAKFSAHVTCHFPKDLLFPTNVSIRHLSDILGRKLLENPPFRLKNSDGKEIPIFDSAVYTKNRNFRLFLSAKLGKNAILRLAPYCRFYELRGISKPSDERIFFDSLCVPVGYHKCPTIFTEQLSVTTVATGDTRIASKYTSSGKNGQGPSPFPHIDDFIVLMLQKWRRDVYIHHWKTTENDGKVTRITYYPQNCRYCFNIGREHKSNGTFWTVDLEKGHFYQKCFDPDCRNATSNYFPLPAHLITEVAAEKEPDEDDLEISRVELEKFFCNWEQVFDV